MKRWDLMHTKGRSLLGFDQNDAQNSTSCDQNDVQKRIPILCWDLMDTKGKSLLDWELIRMMLKVQQLVTQKICGFDQNDVQK